MSRETQCQSCGATIFSEQVESGLARYEGGKLLCMHCVEEFSREQDQGSKTGSGYQFEPIAFRDDAPAPTRSGSALGAAPPAGGGGGSPGGSARPRIEPAYKRPLNPAAAGATRCRTFHCKLNDSAIEFMNTIINQWLDDHPDITIKFATSTLGVFEGKSKEQNVILTLFY